MKFRFQRKYFSIPYIIFLCAFVLIPIILIIYYAFSDTSGALSLEAAKNFFQDTAKLEVILVSFFISIQTTLICLLIGYPLAYLLAKNNKDKSALPYKSLDKHGVAPTDASAKSDNISNFGNHNSSYDNYTFGSGFGTFNGDEESRQLLNKLGKSALDDYFEGLLDIKQRSPKFVASENGGGIAISMPSKPRSIADAGKFILKNFF